MKTTHNIYADSWKTIKIKQIKKYDKKFYKKKQNFKSSFN